MSTELDQLEWSIAAQDAEDMAPIGRSFLSVGPDIVVTVEAPKRLGKERGQVARRIAAAQVMCDELHRAKFSLAVLKVWALQNANDQDVIDLLDEMIAGNKEAIAKAEDR